MDDVRITKDEVPDGPRRVHSCSVLRVCAMLSVAMFCGLNVADCEHFGTASLQM
jgi:hypothetical protein